MNSFRGYHYIKLKYNENEINAIKLTWNQQKFKIELIATIRSSVKRSMALMNLKIKQFINITSKFVFVLQSFICNNIYHIPHNSFCISNFLIINSLCWSNKKIIIANTFDNDTGSCFNSYHFNGHTHSLAHLLKYIHAKTTDNIFCCWSIIFG